MILKRIAAAALLAGSFIASAAQAQTLRFGHANTTAEIAGELFQEFADRVKKCTGGAVTINVFPAEQLGKEVDLFKQVKEGALDLSAPSMAASISCSTSCATNTTSSRSAASGTGAGAT